MSQHNCLNCKWAEWPMTKHKKPRINPSEPGCSLKPTRVIAPLASCLLGFGKDKPAHGEYLQNVRISSTSPYEKCPTFEHKAPALTSRKGS